MTTISIDKLRYPIGKFNKPEIYSDEQMRKWIHAIDHLPNAVRAAVQELDDSQLDTPYREGGWTIRQVVHHLVDSHINSYCRFKLAMTEDNPVIKPYHEDRWSDMTDEKSAPVELSLRLLESLHARWVYFLRTLKNDDWLRTFHHPESGRDHELREILALYAWHGEHHLAHITSLKERMNWN